MKMVTCKFAQNEVAQQRFRPGVCRTWGIEREKAAERGQIVTISQVHSETMGQASGEIDH